MKRIDKPFTVVYAVMEGGFLWDSAIESLDKAKKLIESLIDNGSDSEEFVIYELVEATRPKQTKIEWE